jgi:4-phospho-D-threonate 3-dehydrogenase / 4-phospho-D-erythronate 3-dehydrogenase
MSRLVRIAVSIGDPAGIGAEIALKALRDESIAELAEWLLVADSAALKAASRVCSIDPTALPCKLVETGTLDADHEVAFGRLSAGYGLAAVAYVRRAVELCMGGEADAMVTAPLNKEAVSLSGGHFSGHTEFIAELTGSAESRMLLYSEKLATVHVSTHIPLEHCPHHPAWQRCRAMDASPRAAHRGLRTQSARRRARSLRLAGSRHYRSRD